MSVDQHLSIPTEKLQIGTLLSFDLIDSDGLVLQKAGMAVDERLHQRLRERGITSLIAGESPEPLSANANSVLLSAFSEQTIKRLIASMLNAKSSLLGVLNSLHHNEECSVETVSTSIGEFIFQAKLDIASTLAAIALICDLAPTKTVDSIADYAARLSLLSVAMSVAQNDAPIDSFQIGMAALLHDCSLLFNHDWFSATPNARNESMRKKYRRHPIDSADLLNGVVGIPKSVLVMITELHEQADGTGYPMGLMAGRVKPGSEILNLADAYLSLTSPILGRSIVPSDVLAYLCFHSSKGKFNRETLQVLTQNLSMYPIGSTVELDDQSMAMVVRGNSNAPLSPIVRMIQPGHLDIDLRESKRFISGPIVKADRKAQRLSKSRIHEILWKTDR